MLNTPKFTRCSRFFAASIAVIALLTPSAEAWTPAPQTVLYDFHGRDGSAPYQVVEGADGTLYGATSRGGTYGSGTVFALKPPIRGAGAWTLTVLASIPPGLPGQLIIDKSGAFALYGTIPQGGLPGPYDGYCDLSGHDDGCGTVFRLSPPARGRGAWTTTTIYEFTGYSDGGEPGGGIAATGGSLFGIVSAGGPPYCHLQSGCGGVFALSPPPRGQVAWTESLSLGFGPNSARSGPFAQLLGAGVKGDVYGMYSYGDGYEYVFGLGQGVFASFKSEGTPAGIVADERGAVYVWTSTSTLYAFSPPNFTKRLIYHLPASGVSVKAAHCGAVYGVYSPAGKGASIVALVPPAHGQTAWSPRFLYTFAGHSDGASPNSLLFGKSGDLYGTTSAGGVANNGVIFRLSMHRHAP